MANPFESQNIVKYGTPVLLTGTSIFITIYFHLTLVLNILIPLTVFLVYSILFIISELRKSREEVKYLSQNFHRYPRYRYRRYWSPLDKERDMHKWDFLLNESEEAYMIAETIYRMERKSDIQLSIPTKEMIIIPIIENYDMTGEFNLRKIETSISTLFNTMQESPASLDLETKHKRSTQSLIKSFWKNFCRIPPFCSQKDSDNGDQG